MQNHVIRSDSGFRIPNFHIPDPEVFSVKTAKFFASVTVTNVGACRGAEVVQVYVANPSDSAVFRPKKNFAHLKKVWLDPSGKPMRNARSLMKKTCRF